MRLAKSKRVGWVIVLLLAAGLVTKGVFSWWKEWQTEQFRHDYILVNEGGIKWLSLAEDDKSMQVFELAGNVLVDVVGMKGGLRSEVVWKFGEGEGRPVEIVERSVELMFGAVADGVIYMPGNEVGTKSQVLKGALSLKSKTDLSWGERWNLYWKIRALREDQVEEVRMPTNIGVEEELPDGTKVIGIDRQRLDLLVADRLANEAVMGAEARLVIVNGSGIAGMGKLAERFLKTAGGLVVEVKEGDLRDGWCGFGGERSTLAANRGLVDWLRFKLGCERIEAKEFKLNAGELGIRVGEEWGRAYSR